MSSSKTKIKPELMPQEQEDSNYKIKQIPKLTKRFGVNEFLQEQFKGKVLTEPASVRGDVGVKHPFNFEMAEKLYKSEAFTHGAIDKFVDEVVGGGFFVKSDDERTQQIVEDYFRDINFDSFLREWTKEALIYGNGFMELSGQLDEVPKELKILDAQNMFVRIDKGDLGKVEGYTQHIGDLKRKITDVKFKPFEVAHLTHNKLGASPYGLGMIFPAINPLNNKLQAERDMNTIMSRKANSPMHVKLGQSKDGFEPKASDIQSFGADLEWLNNKHEWCTSDLVDISVIDFGDIGQKFQPILEYNIQQLIFAFQVPAVLMGLANVPEGLAKEQGNSFTKRIVAIQQEIEKVVEEQIIKRVVEANGLNAHVEFEWGVPSEEEKRAEIERINKLLELFNLNPLLRETLEKRLAQLMELDIDLDSPEAQRAKAEAEKQPLVPGQNRQPNDKKQVNPRFNAAQKKAKQDQKPINQHYHMNEAFAEEVMNMKVDEWTCLTKLKEWLDFDYQRYTEAIIRFVKSDKFEERETIQFKTIPGTEGLEWEEVVTKYSLGENLEPTQIRELKKVLIEGFEDNHSIKEITNNIENRVNPKDLTITDKNGTEKKITGKNRAISMARTETVRASSQGTLLDYKEHDIKLVEWVATGGGNVCPYCESHHGMVMSITEANERIPAHDRCNCIFLPVVKG